MESEQTCPVRSTCNAELIATTRVSTITRHGRPRSQTTPPDQAPNPDAMADLLRRYGAVDDLPKVDRIMVQRHSTGESDTAFTKGAQDWSQFTLLDLIGIQYGFLAASPLDGGGDGYSLAAFFHNFSHLPFPDRSEEHTSELQSLRHLVCRL